METFRWLADNHLSVISAQPYNAITNSKAVPVLLAIDHTLIYIRIFPFP
jgi:hypothetical protein